MLKPVNSKGTLIAGIDAYHGDNEATFQTYLASSFVKFAFHKASEGVSMTDNALHSRWIAMRATGKVIGAYHFFHPSKSPVQQAQWFYKACGGLIQKGDMIWMDWESTDELPSASDVDAAYAFLTACDRLFGIKCGVYSGPYFLNDASPDERFKDRTLWIAEYGVTQPKIATPWTDWQFWQYSSDEIDTTFFNGTEDQLRALAGKV